MTQTKQVRLREKQIAFLIDGLKDLRAFYRSMMPPKNLIDPTMEEETRQYSSKIAKTNNLIRKLKKIN